MNTRTIGGRTVGAVGLGGVHWSLPSALEPDAVRRTIYAALDAGVTLIDTAYAYTTTGEVCHNERLISKSLALHPARSEVLIATKGGHYRSPDGFPIDARPAVLREHCEASLRALDVDRIGLYQLHHPDPLVPLAESVGALAHLRAEGKINLIGLSNVTVAQLDEAALVTPIASVQNHFSLQDQADQPMIAACEARGIAYLAYSPLGGVSHAGELGHGFQVGAAVAARHGVSVYQVVIAWLLAQSSTLIPIVGAKRPMSITDSAGGASLILDDIDLVALGRVV